VIQNLYEWEAEYLIGNIGGKTNPQHNADLIRKLQGWENGLDPFTDQDLEDICNSELFIEQVDVADAFKAYRKTRVVSPPG
jgi:hypothetical protein